MRTCGGGGGLEGVVYVLVFRRVGGAGRTVVPVTNGGTDDRNVIFGSASSVPPYCPCYGTEHDSKARRKWYYPTVLLINWPMYCVHGRDDRYISGVLMQNDPFSSFNNLSDKEQAIAREYAAIFLHQKAKEKMIGQLDAEYASGLAVIIWTTTHVSERLLDKARSDPEYQNILRMFRFSKEKGKIEDDLLVEFQARKSKSIDELSLIREQLRDEILGSERSNYRSLLEGDHKSKKEICTRIWGNARKNAAKQDLVEKFDKLSRSINFIEQVPVFSLTDAMLRFTVGEIDILEHFAFLVYQPKHQIMFEVYDPAWTHFPLKWYKDRLGIADFKTLFDMFKEGEDVSEFFLEQLHAQGIDDLINLIDDAVIYLPIRHVHEGAKVALEQALECYKSESYMSCIYTVLPLIEGILWSYSVFLDTVDKLPIYVANSNHQEIQDKDTGGSTARCTIGILLSKSVFGNLFDNDFIRYFCDELYNERNPILHGREFGFGSRINCLKKIATLEYILSTMQHQLSERLIKRLNDKVPPGMAEESLESLRQ